MRIARSLAVVVAVFAALLAADPAHALFMAPQGTPVDRLVKNIEAYVKEKPDDANAWYLLGRVHALAYRYNRNVVGTFPQRANQEGGLPNVAGDHMQGWIRPAPPKPQAIPAPGQPAPIEAAPAPAAARAPAPEGEGEQVEVRELSDEEKAQHLAAAIAGYQKAIALDPAPAHYHLGLAFVLDTGRELVGRVPPVDVRTTDGKPTYAEAAKAYELLHTEGEDKPVRTMLLQTYWREAAIEKYLDAYNRSSAKDAEINFKPIAGMNSLVSYEAGNAYIKLLNSREMTDGEKQSLASVQQHIKALDGKPHGPVTPIVFRLDRAMPLKMMLGPADRTVRFDLDGDGTAELRPWVAPDTAILCWDPYRTGRITSGKQLFGSVTFHLYPGDGYTAMNLLDDNRDGELAGSELPGLALWFDRNTNGVSDPGEVVPIEESPIKSLSVRELTKEGDAPANPFGLKLKDGRTLPTYDWIAPMAP